MNGLDVILLLFWVSSWALILTVYLHTVLLSFFGVRPWRRPQTHPPTKRFAVLVPAHNEERVIRAILEDLNAQEYPRDLCDVYVIADNCTDRTLQEARSVPGVRVIVRSGGEPGKGPALHVAIDWLLEGDRRTEGKRYDAIVFFDADNRVSRNFLQKMNDELCEGNQLVQGFIGTKNPRDNWVTRVVYQSYCMTNRLWQLAKRRAGLPSQCGGTGFCIDTDVLRELGWPMTSTTEDLELVCILARRGIFPVWAHDAVVYDEKPRSMIVAFRQRTRWMRGHLTNLARHFGPLVREGIAKRDARLLDCALYLLYPVCVMAIGAHGVLWLLNVALFPDLLVVGPGLPATILVLMVLIYYPVVGVYLETRSWRELAYLPLLLAFNWIWVAAAYVALFTIGSRRWYHTPHGASLDEGIRL